MLGRNKAKETVIKSNGHLKSCVKDAIEDQLIQIDFRQELIIGHLVKMKYK